MSRSLNTPEILTELFLNSDKSTIYSALTVSKQWNDILSKEYFWKQYYKQNFPNNNSLNKLIKQIPNHTYKNVCKYKMANKKQLVSNFYNKKSFPICNLNNIHNLDETEPACVKQDSMVWFDKENLSLKYLEFSKPEEIREFPVGSNIIMVDIIDNLIVCINVDYRITLFSRIKEHNQWHINLVNEPEHENGELFIINSCILDNLITLSFFELLHQEEPDEENENNENPEHQGEFKIFVWDLNLLIKAINSTNVTEDKFYDVKIGNTHITITYNPVIVHNCVYQERNEETGKLENMYYILSSTSDDGVITVYKYDEELNLKEIRSFLYDLEDDFILWASIHSDGTILAIGRKAIEIFSINDKKIEQHRKYASDIFESFHLYDVVLTPELLYVIMFTQGQEEEEEVEPQVRFAVIDISESSRIPSSKPYHNIDREVGEEEEQQVIESTNEVVNTTEQPVDSNHDVGNTEEEEEEQEQEQIIESTNEIVNTSEQPVDSNHDVGNTEEIIDTTNETAMDIDPKPEENIKESTNSKALVTEWSKQEVCFNKFVETGIVHYEPELKQVLFTPFSECFCKE